jgi:RimJ/RimL family protein N-acetyltransferase
MPEARIMAVSLLELPTTALLALAASRVPEGLEGRVEHDALPPAFVATRSLELAAAGHAAPWATTFLIVDQEDSRIIGGCGFKNAPVAGRVEVGYGVAPAARGRGAATEALVLLVRRAFDAGATEVVAEVAPANAASTRVVQKAGFVQVGARLDSDQEFMIQWARRSETRASAAPAAPGPAATDGTAMLSLSRELQALEVELHHPGVRCSRERLEQLLHPEFHEVGRSGRAYDRSTVVGFLTSLKTHPAVVSDSFALSELAAGVALLTYRSAQVEAPGLVHHTLRSSVWMKAPAGWQLRYHQGTPAGQAG